MAERLTEEKLDEILITASQQYEESRQDPAESMEEEELDMILSRASEEYEVSETRWAG